MRRHADRLLTCCRIHNEQSFLWLQEFFQVLELAHQRFIDFLPACGVEDGNGGASSRESGCAGQRGSGDALHIFLARLAGENRNLDLLPERCELFDRRGALQIARD